MNRKKGSAIATTPIITMFSVVILVSVFICILNYTLPFIWYEKLNIIAQKYIYVIEKFGTLTTNERKNLEIDLINKGFDISKVNISLPKENLKYGSLFEFSINYQYLNKELKFTNGLLRYKESLLPLKVSKYGYIKSNIK